ncbi:hypothetical protein [Streptomyces sp. NBC_00454]|uniref:hypothetical protein n=1 Tax=Streptomyces sp. NBC_00454 TaxID=2975747 RepID=UPI0030E16635
MRTERGLPARRWLTVPAARTVLGVIHNVTSATRLLDVLQVFEADPRVRVVFTCTGSSAFEDGIAEFVSAHGLFFLPWESALKERFDLAVSTSRGGNLEDISAPLIGAPHGAGYNKKLSKNPESGIRNPESGAGAGAFGLTAEWLLHDGEVVPSVIVLSHEEQLARLGRDCPEALPYAHVVGDPVADELDASDPFRADYRAAFGIGPEQKLLLITSTWGGDSLFGADIALVERALAELPSDEFRVLAAVHPNAWYGHGEDQIRRWLARALRAGLILPPPAGQGWKAALCAADLYLGDHGSLSLYAAARGLPGVLAAFDDSAVAAGSAMAWLGGALPRLDPGRPLAAQLARARTLPGAADRLTSRAGRAAALLRVLCYRHLRLPEPEFPVVARPVPLPEPAAASPSPLVPASYVSTAIGDREVRVRRHPAELQGRMTAHLGPDAHVTADAAEPDPRLRGMADVLVARPGTDPAAVFARNSRCGLVVSGGRLRLRDGREFAVSGGAEPALAGSVLVALLGEGVEVEGEFGIRAGGVVSVARLALVRDAGEADPGFLGADAPQ